MIGSTVAVFGIFYDKDQAARSVELLLAAGFPEEQISLLAPGDLGTKDLAHDRDAIAGNSTSIVTASVAAGGTLGLLAGFGLLMVPGIGPLLAAGPIAGALAGFGIGGAAGGLIDALDATGLPEQAAARYTGHIAEGGILLSAHCDDLASSERAKDVFFQAGASAITTSAESATTFGAAQDRKAALQ